MNFIRRSFRFFCASIALSYVVLAGTQSSAGPIVGNQVPTLTIQIENVPGSWTYSPPANDYSAAPGDNGHVLNSGTREFDVLDNRARVKIEGLQFDPDPFVLNNILVTNTTTTTQTFSAFVGLPTTFEGPNLISGNVRTNAIDGGNDGATVATNPPQALYQAQIDGVTVQTLQNHPHSVIAPIGGSNTSAESFVPTVNPLPVTSNIGIQLRFSLSSGDTAAILARFDVTKIPEPASVALIGIAMALVAAGTRRRP
jgi:hypothetical protein